LTLVELFTIMFTTYVTDSEISGMASIKRHPRSKYWVGCWTRADGRQTQRSTKCTNRGDALRVALAYEDAEKLARNGQLIESQARKVLDRIFEIANGRKMPSTTIRGFFTSWLKSKETESPKAAKWYRIPIDAFFKFLEGPVECDLASIDLALVQKFRESLLNRIGPSTVNYTIKVIGMGLGQARRQGLISVNPVELVKPIAYKKLERRPFSVDELRLVLAACDDEWRGIVLTGLYTGLRLSDCVNLTFSNVNLDIGEVSVKTRKTGRSGREPVGNSPRHSQRTIIHSSIDRKSRAIVECVAAVIVGSRWSSRLNKNAHQKWIGSQPVPDRFGLAE
jgi:site-specific recombinase XerC